MVRMTSSRSLDAEMVLLTGTAEGGPSIRGEVIVEARHEAWGRSSALHLFIDREG